MSDAIPGKPIFDEAYDLIIEHNPELASDVAKDHRWMKNVTFPRCVRALEYGEGITRNAALLIVDWALTKIMQGHTSKEIADYKMKELKRVIRIQIKKAEE